MKQFDIKFKNGDYLTVTAEFMHTPHVPDINELVTFTTDDETVALVAVNDIQFVTVQVLSGGAA